MTNEEFERLDAELMAQSNKTLLNRTKAYATQTDRLANFKETAQAVGLTPEKVCEVYLYKGLSAMLKILHGAPAIGETMLERFADPINYVRLAYALAQEQRMKPTFITTEKPNSVWFVDPRDCLVTDPLPPSPLKARNRITD